VKVSRELEAVLYSLANAITDAQCRATTKRDERAQLFLDNRTSLLVLCEQILEQTDSSSELKQLPDKIADLSTLYKSFAEDLVRVGRAQQAMATRMKVIEARLGARIPPALDHEGGKLKLDMLGNVLQKWFLQLVVKHDLNSAGAHYRIDADRVLAGPVTVTLGATSITANLVRRE
jgi:hypothetical protein